MEFFIQGGGRVTLTSAEFVGQGGQAAVYARGDTAFKIYADPAAMVPPAKIRELAVLERPNILRPRAMLLDARNLPVGYTMRRAPGGTVLCRLFNRAFRERHGITPERALALVRRLQEGVRYVHERGILIVDLNEMNFLLPNPPTTRRALRPAVSTRRAAATTPVCGRPGSTRCLSRTW